MTDQKMSTWSTAGGGETEKRGGGPNLYGAGLGLNRDNSCLEKA